MRCYKPWFSEKLRQILPCGKCAFCIKKQIDAWCLRISHEMEISSSAHFLTLTYNDEHLPEGGELKKTDLQAYFKRVRKHNKGLRYFAVGEYGSKFKRPHYHAVVFNVDDLSILQKAWTSILDQKTGEFIEMGHMTGSKATMGRIRYMVSYMALPQDVTHKNPPFRIMSRNPGLGKNYVDKMIKHHRARSDSVVMVLDTPNAMPRYYKDKIFTNRYQKRLIQVNALAYSEKHGNKRPSEAEHKYLFDKLNRKNK